MSCDSSSSSNYYHNKVSNYKNSGSESEALINTKNALIHGYKNIVDLSQSWNPNHIWLADLTPCSNVVHINSFFSLPSWLNLILPKKLKYLTEDDLSEIKITGTVYIPIKTETLDYSAIAKPYVIYNKDTGNIEIHFEKVNPFLSDNNNKFQYIFNINKTHLLSQ